MTIKVVVSIVSPLFGERACIIAFTEPLVTNDGDSAPTVRIAPTQHVR
jgi:hypothetical protein